MIETLSLKRAVSRVKKGPPQGDSLTLPGAEVQNRHSAVCLEVLGLGFRV